MGKPAARMGDQTAHGGTIVMGFPMVLIGGKPAARMGDMHVCPMVNPGLPPPPHVGGPVIVGSPTVLIGGMMAARMGDMAVCAGPPDTILVGCPTVLIGEAGGGGGGGGGGSGGGAGGGKESKGDEAKKGKGEAAAKAKGSGPSHGEFSAESSSSSSCSDYGMKIATQGGEPSQDAGHWIEFQFVDKADLPVGGAHFEFEGSDKKKSRGVVQSDGIVRREGIPSGSCTVRLFSVSNAVWSKDEARSGEKLTLSADVEGFPDGTEAKFIIYERDLAGSDDVITAIDAEVEGGKVETEWEYEYTEEDESESSGGPSGYSHPEYFFVVQVEDCAAASGLLFFKDWIEVNLKDAEDKPLGREEYQLVLPSGEVRKGSLDRNGYARIENVPPGRARLEILRYPHAELVG